MDSFSASELLQIYLKNPRNKSADERFTVIKSKINTLSEGVREKKQLVKRLSEDAASAYSSAMKNELLVLLDSRKQGYTWADSNWHVHSMILAMDKVSSSDSAAVDTQLLRVARNSMKYATKQLELVQLEEKRRKGDNVQKQQNSKGNKPKTENISENDPIISEEEFRKKLCVMQQRSLMSNSILATVKKEGNRADVRNSFLSRIYPNTLNCIKQLEQPSAKEDFVTKATAGGSYMAQSLVSGVGKFHSSAKNAISRLGSLADLEWKVDKTGDWFEFIVPELSEGEEIELNLPSGATLDFVIPDYASFGDRLTVHVLDGKVKGIGHTRKGCDTSDEEWQDAHSTQSNEYSVETDDEEEKSNSND